MCLVINKWVIAVNVSNFSGQYLRNHWTLDIGVLGYSGIVWPKEHSPEVWSVPPVTPCIFSGSHSLVFSEYQVIFPRVKTQRSDCSLPSSAKDKNEWRYTCIPAIPLCGMNRNTLLKRRSIKTQQYIQYVKFATCFSNSNHHQADISVHVHDMFSIYMYWNVLKCLPGGGYL